jgi:hypothetical protein
MHLHDHLSTLDIHHGNDTVQIVLSNDGHQWGKLTLSLHDGPLGAHRDANIWGMGFYRREDGKVVTLNADRKP